MSAYTDIRPDIIRYDIGYDIWNYTILISFISYTISHPISHPDQIYIGIYRDRIRYRVTRYRVFHDIVNHDIVNHDIVKHDIVYFTMS